MFLEKFLRILGHKVVGEANIGMQVVKKAKELNTDLMLMDIAMLGKIDGIEAVKEIRKKGKNVPVILVTAHDMCHDQLKNLGSSYGFSEAAQYGATGYHGEVHPQFTMEIFLFLFFFILNLLDLYSLKH